jgi:hypothetical protein
MYYWRLEREIALECVSDATSSLQLDRAFTPYTRREAGARGLSVRRAVLQLPTASVRIPLRRMARPVGWDGDGPEDEASREQRKSTRGAAVARDSNRHGTRMSGRRRSCDDLPVEELSVVWLVPRPEDIGAPTIFLRISYQ